MKAITIWQPWASLLACGAKKYETRSWATSYRGPIVIHAAIKPIRWIDWLFEPEFTNALSCAFPALRSGAELPRGCIIATAELVGCRLIRRNPHDGVVHILNDAEAAICIDGNELLFGDWTPGRFAWEFANMQMLPEPIPAKGAQGLWNWTQQSTF